jgi:hypothetical protein
MALLSGALAAAAALLVLVLALQTECIAAQGAAQGAALAAIQSSLTSSESLGWAAADPTKNPCDTMAYPQGTWAAFPGVSCDGDRVNSM